jgi:hypothetical protein
MQGNVCFAKTGQNFAPLKRAFAAWRPRLLKAAIEDLTARGVKVAVPDAQTYSEHWSFGKRKDMKRTKTTQGPWRL